MKLFKLFFETWIKMGSKTYRIRGHYGWLVLASLAAINKKLFEKQISVKKVNWPQRWVRFIAKEWEVVTNWQSKIIFWTNFFTRIVHIRQIAYLDQGLVNLEDQWSRFKRRNESAEPLNNESAEIISFILVVYCCCGGP